MARKINQNIVEKFKDEIISFSGQVVGDVQIWNETHVSGGGSGKNAMPVSSVNTAWTQFFLQTKGGQEIEVKVPKALGVRTGNRVSIERFRNGTPAILNHDLGRLHWFTTEAASNLSGREYRAFHPIVSWVAGLLLSLAYVVPGLLWLALVFIIRNGNRRNIANTIANYAADKLDGAPVDNASFSQGDRAEFISDIIKIPS